jgi:hypothetical protein
MTRNLHDSFAKEWFQELLVDFGKVEIEKQIPGEIRKIDVFFSPNSSNLENRQALGLFGQILATPSLLEAFRNAAPEWEIRNCREKGFQVEAEMLRQAKQTNQKLQDPDRPFTWILSPTLSEDLKQRFRVSEESGWSQGIYFLAPPDRTAIVAIHHLPKTIDTLWLRLLGRGRVQAQAIKELLALPTNHPYRQETLRHIAILQVNLEIRQNKTKEVKEVMMNLAPAYEQWLNTNRQAAREETQLEIARRMLDKQIPLAEIAEITGLPIATIQSLSTQSQ